MEHKGGGTASVSPSGGDTKHLRPVQIRYSTNRAVLGKERPLSLYKATMQLKAAGLLSKNQPCEKEGQIKPGKRGIHV